EARTAGFDKDPVIARQLEVAIEKVLSQAWIESLDAKIQAEFDANPEKYLPRAREIYSTSPDKFRTQEKVHVYHVMIRVGADGDEAAKARAEAIRAKVLAGAPISDLARESSDDPSAKRNGGDLGFIGAKDFDPTFADAAFALSKPGEVSPVTKSKF